jgi:hypothetical protein
MLWITHIKVKCGGTFAILSKFKNKIGGGFTKVAINVSNLA